MTRRASIPPFLAVLVVATAAWAADLPAPKTGKPLGAGFLRTYAETRGFMLGRPVQARPTPDGKAVLFLRAEATKPKLSLYEFNVATGKTRELLTPEAVLKGAEERLTPEEKARRERMRVSLGGFADYQLSEDGRLILLSLSGKLYVYDRDKGAVRELVTGHVGESLRDSQSRLGETRPRDASGSRTLLDPKFSPDGRKVAYVLDHDVYVYDLAANKESPVTAGGTAKKTHGLAEFVAQEEMDRHSGYWWSPDSRRIAYEEADHEGVEVWHVADPAKPEQLPSEQFYPRPGKQNVAVRLGIVAIAGGETVWVDWDGKKYEYLAAVRWDELGPLTIQVQDRLQQELLLLKVDPATGHTTKLLEEKDPAWVNLDQQVPRWLEGGKEFVWISESKGGRAIELRDADGKLQRVLAPPPPRDLELVDVDAKHGRVAFAAGADPTERRLYEVGHEGVRIHKGGLPGLDVLSEKATWSSAAFAKDHGTHVLTSTTLERMPRSTVQNEKGFAGQLPSVALEPDFAPNVTIQKVGDGEGFYTAVVRPRDFDPKKKYPVIDFVYGGPTAQTVTRAMAPWLLKQWLADQGFLVVSIDNRGTPGRGHDWERAVYQKFGDVPLEDQVRGLRALGERFPEMDLNRVGIVGWSFGGYLSALAVLKRPDVFKAAVAGAPVTDWEDYDTHYTERYLGLPREHAEAYKESSLLPLAGKLKRPLLLVHGTADDNVYFRHTLRLTDALFRAGSDFEVLPLPSLTHMVPDPVVTERLWTRIAGHFAKHLGR